MNWRGERDGTMPPKNTEIENTEMEYKDNYAYGHIKSKRKEKFTIIR